MERAIERKEKTIPRPQSPEQDRKLLFFFIQRVIKKMFIDLEKKEIRRDVAERVAWAAFKGDQLDLGLMIESHYKKSFYLTFDERELICTAWKEIEEERAKSPNLNKTKKTVPKKKKKKSGSGPDED